MSPLDNLPDLNRSDGTEQAERLKAVLDAAVDAIVTIDDSGRIDSVNRAATTVFGYEPDEMLGRNVSILMPEPFAEEHDAYLRQYLTSGRKRIIGVGREVVGLKKSGEVFPMSLAVGEVNLFGKRLFTGIIRDLTEEKAVEAELLKREKQVRFMVENLPAGAMYVDRYHRTVLCNNAIETITGYDSSQLSTLDKLFETLFGDAAEAELKKYEASITDGNTDQHISTIVTADGNERDLEFTRYRYDHHEVWLVYDRTEQLRAAEQIRRERDFVSRLLETTQAVITVIGPNCEIVRCNQAAVGVAGVSESNLIGRNWCDIFCGTRECDACSGDLAKALLTGKKIEGSLVSTTRPDGQRHDVLWWGGVFADTTIANETAVLVGQDVTEFRNAQKRVLQSERLAAIGQMVTGLAHESRNALQRAQAGLDVLALDVPDSQRNLVEKVGAAITHVYRLYDEVRDYAAPIQLQREWIAISTVWERAWRSVLEASEIELQMEVHNPSGCSTECDIDPYRIEQVFRNLFENALAVSQDGDTISIDVKSDCVKGEASAGESWISVTVSDVGPGLTADQKTRVFEPFYTTKQRGTGLGMAIVARILEEHGGEISIGDAQPTGAAVTIRLPRGHKRGNG